MTWVYNFAEAMARLTRERAETEAEPPRIQLPVRFNWQDYQLGRFGYWIYSEISQLNISLECAVRASQTACFPRLYHHLDTIRSILRNKVIKNPSELHSSVLVEFHRTLDEIDQAVREFALAAINRDIIPRELSTLNLSVSSYYELLGQLFASGHDKSGLQLGNQIWQIISLDTDSAQEESDFYVPDVLNELRMLIDQLQIREWFPPEQLPKLYLEFLRQPSWNLIANDSGNEPTTIVSLLPLLEQPEYHIPSSGLTWNQVVQEFLVFDTTLVELSARFVQPDNVLTISQNEIVFLGQSVQVETSQFERPQLAILWELANCAPSRLTASELDKRTGSRRANQSELVCRLRNQWERVFGELPSRQPRFTTKDMFPNAGKSALGSGYRLGIDRSEIMIVDRENPFLG
jgi:hypothetical protein